MAITDKEKGVWGLEEVYNKINQGGIWNYDTSITGLFSWGRNWGGALGVPGAARSSPTQVGTDSTWKYLGPTNEAKGVTAIKTDGTLWAWGNNDKGSLGHNNLTAYSSPKQVGTDATWSTTTSSMAVKTDGSLWSWGYNFLGNMGTNDRVPRSSPMQVGTDTDWVTDRMGALARAADGGGVAGCLKKDGNNVNLWTMGGNNYGSLGQNNKTSYSSPVMVGNDTGDDQWTNIGCTFYGLTMYGVKPDGTLWSWGRNDMGQLGQNNKTEYSSPRQVGTDQIWGDVSRGGNYHWFATKGDGTLWGFGYNGSGNMGQNDTVERSSPIQIPGTTWKSVDDTERSTLASKTDGTLWSWGLSNYGALGLNQGPGTDHSSPTQIPGSWEGNKGEMASGYWESYAIKSDLS